MTGFLLRLSLPAALVAFVAGCGTGEPVPKVYVLDETTAPVAETVSQLGLPAVEVRPVRVPDYLDTTDIVTRGSDGLALASRSGQWGDRLSIGVTRTVVETLTSRLPQLSISQSPPLGLPRWRVRIVIDAFDVAPEGTTLVAKWTVVDGASTRPDLDERVVLTSKAPHGRDTEVVAAMRQEIVELSERIAASLAQLAEGSDGGTKREQSG
jgi:uncharacterized lipoprotein YmbA